MSHYYAKAAAGASLVNTGLLVRYKIDEAASGTTPTALVDSSGNGYNLTTINYGAGNMAYNEVSGNRGLDSTTSASGDQQVKRQISDTSDTVRTGMAGVQKATFEIVVRIDAVASASGNRIWALGVNASTRCAIGITTDSASSWGVEWNTGLIQFWNGTEGVRQVIHAVYDSTQATDADRVKVYVDGSQITPSVNATITLNDTLTLAASTQLVGINRDSGWGNPFDGMLFYAALYNVAFSGADVTQNYNILTADDD